jgi:energy-coupling factor transporter ATP-binding protein EcfA2
MSSISAGFGLGRPGLDSESSRREASEWGRRGELALIESLLYPRGWNLLPRAPVPFLDITYSDVYYKGLETIDMGKIRVQDLAKMMGISNQDLVFKLKSIGASIEGDDAHIDTEIIQAILHPRTLIKKVAAKQDDSGELPASTLEQENSKKIAELREAVRQLEIEIAYIKYESNEIDKTLLQVRLAENIAELEMLSADFPALEHSVASLLKRTVQAGSSSLGNFIAGLDKRMEVLENSMAKIIQSSGLGNEIAGRIKAAQKLGDKLKEKKFRSPLSASDLVARLEDRDFLISEKLAKTLIEQLETRKLIILEGVPGTGKSSLARHLADIFLTSSQGRPYTQVSVFPEAGAWHSIGGLRLVGNNFVPHFGWVTEAVINCIESEGHHWLILDEINRGDLSNLLGPILDALEPSSEGYVVHPNLFPESGQQVGNIPVPGNFRIIGTRNPFDTDVLFDLTHALARRVGIVLVPPLVDSAEASFINNVVVRRVTQEVSNVNPNGLDVLGGRIAYLVQRLRFVVGAMRSLASRDPVHLYRYCEVGTALMIELVERACRRCIEARAENNAALDDIVDQVISELLFSGIDHYGVQALKALRDEIFDPGWSPACWALINSKLRS